MPPDFLVAIPIAVFMIIGAGMASSSRFHRARKFVHDALETVNAMRRNMHLRIGGKLVTRHDLGRNGRLMGQALRPLARELLRFAREVAWPPRLASSTLRHEVNSNRTHAGTYQHPDD